MNPKKLMETTRTYDDINLGLVSIGKNTSKELMKEANLSKAAIFRIT